jgi:hypothetical protein
MKPNYPVGPPMTLGKMRELGVRVVSRARSPTAPTPLVCSNTAQSYACEMNRAHVQSALTYMPEKEWARPSRLEEQPRQCVPRCVRVSIEISWPSVFSHYSLCSAPPSINASGRATTSNGRRSAATPKRPCTIAAPIIRIDPIK